MTATATSPYAVPRRRSSAGAVAARCGAVVLCWHVLRGGRRIASGTDDAARPSLRDALHAVAEALLSATLGGGEPLERADGASSASAVLRWLVAVAGGRRSAAGRMIAVLVHGAGELLSRCVGAGCLVLTGAPSLGPSKAGFEGVRGAPPNDERADARGARDRAPADADAEADAADDTLRRDWRQVNEVLRYWFGRSPDVAQKGLWMIAASSAALRARVDADVAARFRPLIAALASEADNDADGGGRRLLRRWTEDGALGWQGKVAAIVVLDQMGRHVRRHDAAAAAGRAGGAAHAEEEDGAAPLPAQRRLDDLARDVAMALRERHGAELAAGMVPPAMRVFGSMPLRHASTVDDLGEVQRDVEAAAALHEETDRLLRRFRAATNRRLAALQDAARRDGGRGGGAAAAAAEEEDGRFDDGALLEGVPFAADTSAARDHAVVRVVGAFLRERGLLNGAGDARFDSARRTAGSPRGGGQPEAPAAVGRTAIVSLSGGVDSMVIAAAVAHLRDEEARRRRVTPDAVLSIVAVHIDYANRPESGAEAAYVERYCQELNIKYACRKIHEVTRGITARDDYERIARQIRFDLYRQCCAEAQSGSGGGEIGVMLGHHRGDVRENVISNALKGCGPLDLSGMTAVSRNDGVSLFRPLLSLEKACIYDYAHAFGVPYFKDTTPRWSTRGKLRRRLLPLLEEMYGEGSVRDNLSALGDDSDAARALLQRAVVAPFEERVARHPMGVSFHTAPWKDCGLFFWKFVLRKVLHSAGLGMFSDKSVESFLTGIEATNVKKRWLQCRKDYAVFLQQDGRVFVFYPNSFPLGNGQKEDEPYKGCKFLGYGPENCIAAGPWTIVSSIVKAASEKEADALLQTKALKNMEHLAAGDISYFLKIPLASGAASPRPLVRIKGFTKSTRPAGWKSFDPKVEKTLPLLGVDHSALDDNSEEWALVKVRLYLDPRRA